MKTTKLTTRLSQEEKETIIRYDPMEKQWTMDSTVPKPFNKALRQGWTPVEEYVYEDGTVCGMILTAAERAITIKTPIKREVSDSQRNNCFGRNS